MSGWRLSRRASDGLLRIAGHVQDLFGPELAHEVVDGIERALERLAENPSIGHRREDLTKDPRILFWTFGPSLIAYRTSPESIEILFIERGSADWETMLESLD